MIDIIRPILEFSVLLPGTLLAYFPMKHHMRIRKGKLAAIIAPTLLLLCILSGVCCYFMQIQTFWIMIPVLFITGVAYCQSLTLTVWKSVSVALAVCGVFSSVRGAATAIDALLCPDNASEWFCLSAGLIYNLLCWILVILLWYPAAHAACNLLEYEGIARTWYVFWILPLLFIGLNFFLTPIYYELLYLGRIMKLYIVNNIALLFLLLLFYFLFYLMANSLNRNDRLRQENQFLYMQQTQYEMLCTAIEETRQARHDMRHHFSTLAALADSKEWQELEKYLSQAKESIPNTELNFCENPAANGVASHYCLKYKENDIPCSVELDLPHKLPVSEMDICIVLSNLMENALEASLRTNKAGRHIKVQAYLHSDNVILITVENTFEGNIKEKNGIYQSSKHRGNGIGIQSVRRIAEKNGGYCRFTWQDGIFCANIMLRNEINS